LWGAGAFTHVRATGHRTVAQRVVGTAQSVRR
jgi:hypothetical protein